MEAMRVHSFRHRLLLESDVAAYFQKLLRELDELENCEPTEDYADGKLRLDGSASRHTKANP